MTTKTKNKLAYVVFSFLLSLPAMLVHAQGGPGGPGGPPDPSVPFDGGLSLVVAAGIAYAAKKGYDKRKKERAEEPTGK